MAAFVDLRFESAEGSVVGFHRAGPTVIGEEEQVRVMELARE